MLSSLAVIAFHFPSYLSTPELRNVYDVEWLRLLLFIVLQFSIATATISLIFGNKRKIALYSILLVAIAGILGGSQVHVQTPVAQKKYFLSLDLIILDMLIMSFLYVPLERLFWLRKQRILREGLKTDVLHYSVNHLLMGALLYIIYIPGNKLRSLFPNIGLEDFLQDLPIFLQALLILFCADFFQYWTHRFFHNNPSLWQFHKVHHSVKCMDWIASSRLHIVDILITRSISYIPIVCLGFSHEAFQLYLPLVALQAVFVHANVRFGFGPLRYILTTPLVHHWHHSCEDEALNKNFAVSFSCIDVVFGTFYCPKKWPNQYGLNQEKISEKFFKQLFYPFVNVAIQKKARELDRSKS